MTDWQSYRPLHPEARPELAFTRYDMTPRELRDGLEAWLEDAAEASVAVIRGASHSGRSSAVGGAAWALRERTPYELVAADLVGYDVNSTPEAFLRLRLELLDAAPTIDVLARGGDALRQGAGFGTAWAIAIAALFEVPDPAKSLTRLFAKANTGSEAVDGPALFEGLLEELSQDGARPLLIVDSSRLSIPPAGSTRRHLIDAVQRHPTARLALLACTNDDPSIVAPGCNSAPAAFEVPQLSEDQIRSTLESTFAPSELDAHVARLLHDASGGRPAAISGLLAELVARGRVIRNEEQSWQAAEPLDGAELWSWIGDRFADLPEIERGRLKQFVLEASLCGDLVPATLLLANYGYVEEVRDELIDAIEERMCEGDAPIFRDLEFGHPAFGSRVWTLKFTHRHLRHACQAQLTPWERQEIARRLLGQLNETPLRPTRDFHHFVIELARELEDDSLLRSSTERLEWLIDAAEAPGLESYIRDRLEAGRLRPETALAAGLATNPTVPEALRSIALLRALDRGPGFPDVAQFAGPFRLAQNHFFVGAFEEAIAAARVAETRASEPPERFVSGTIIARSLDARGQRAEAIERLEDLLGSQDVAGNEEAPWVVDAKEAYAHALAPERPADAATVLLELRSLVEQQHGAMSIPSINLRTSAVDCLLASNQSEQAADLAAEVLSDAEQLVGNQHPQVARLRAQASLARAAAARTTEALTQLDRATDALTAFAPPNDPAVQHYRLQATELSLRIEGRDRATERLEAIPRESLVEALALRWDRIHASVVGERA